MTTTVTTGLALGTGGLAAAAAVAGAVGLGLLGLAALTHRGGGGGKKKGYGHKHHGYGYGYQGYHRHRRSVEEQSEAIDNMMDLIRQEDVTGCGLRLMCELSGMNPDDLSLEELAIIDLVGPVPKPGEGLLPEGGTGDYMLAKGIGQNGGSCGEAYPMCVLNGTQLMDVVMKFLP